MSETSRRDVLTSVVTGASCSVLLGAPSLSAPVAAAPAEGDTPLFVGPFVPAEWFRATRASVLLKSEPETERKAVDAYIENSLKDTRIFVHDVVRHEAGGERFAKEGYPVGIVKWSMPKPLKTKEYEYNYFISKIDFLDLVTKNGAGATRRIGTVTVQLCVIRSREDCCLMHTHVFLPGDLLKDNEIIYNTRGELVKGGPAPKKP
ncbi:MAG TPA: hypothetical protein VGE74_16790 [Gemmata sp.]